MSSGAGAPIPPTNVPRCKFQPGDYFTTNDAPGNGFIWQIDKVFWSNGQWLYDYHAVSSGYQCVAMTTYLIDKHCLPVEVPPW
jgi:hypothetical protein